MYHILIVFSIPKHFRQIKILLSCLSHETSQRVQIFWMAACLDIFNIRQSEYTLYHNNNSGSNHFAQQTSDFHLNYLNVQA